jgi:glutaredoxin
MKQNKLFITIGVLAVLLVASVIWAFTASTGSTAQAIDIEEARAQAETFINENLMVGGQTVNVNSIVEENGLYKMAIDIGQGEVVTSYLNLDASTFFPQGLDMTGSEADNTASNNADSANNNSEPVVPTNIVKSERPNVELFIMSHCPFGTQIEKGILPVANLLEDKIDFEIKFVDYAMHGEKELNEQMNQYCIMQEEPDKFNNYLSCFLAEGNGDSCLTELDINTSAMNSCVDNVNEEYKIIENFENNVNYQGSYPEFAIHKAENEEYGVDGSPTLVINGSKVSSGRDSATLLATVCAAFEGEAPSECDTELSNSAPSSGFGYNTAGSNATAAATCN